MILPSSLHIIKYYYEKIKVKQILKKYVQIYRYPKIQYLVQWKLYLLYKTNWEPIAHLANSPLVIQAFECFGNKNIIFKKEKFGIISN